ncbi:t-SNARE, partial [Penicillium waksmanii]|uniref:t-SNARE n=1 Tax=Penicillium waksmanii TaxID=69791 RepID=UPI002546C1E8
YQSLGDNQGGYGQYDPYGAQQNPYGQQQQSYGYGGAAEQGNGGYEMSNMQQQSGGGPSAILNKCKEMSDGINQLRTKRETTLIPAQNVLLDSATSKEDQVARQNVDYIEDEINTALRYLRDQFKRIKETPGSGDPRVSGQVENVNRNLRREIEQYQRTQSDFRKRLEEQIRRRYEIANPEATPEELEQGVQNVMAGQEQAFMTPGTRSRQANDARQATMERSAAIRKIEQDMIALGQLYQEVAELVHQQEPAVAQIEQGAEETHRNVAQANTKLDSAITSARNARRWKWYALIIVIIIIAIIVGVAVGVTEANKSK